MNNNPLFTVSVLAVAISQVVYAKDEEPIVLEKVVVTGRKPSTGPLTKSEISVKEITERQAQIQDSTKLLEDIPGISLQAGGGVSSLPVIHGLNDDRVKIDVNGMSITSACANHMNPPLSYIDRTNIGKITVLQGVTPVSMGGDSIGGTIIVQSPDPIFAEPGKDILLDGRLSSFYRSNGDVFGGSIAAGIANQNVRLDYTGSHSQSENYSDGNDKAVKSTSYENQNHAINLALKLDNHLLEFRGGQQHIPYQGFPTQRMDLTRNDSIFGNLHYKGKFDWGNLEGKLYLENTIHGMNFMDDKLTSNPASAPGMHSPMPMDVRGHNFGYKIQAELPINEWHLIRVGNEFHSNRLNEWWDAVPPYVGAPRTARGGMWPNDFINLNNATRDRLGTYAEWEVNWSPEWKSMLGLRYDHIMADTGNIQPYKDPIISPTNSTVLEAARWNKLGHERNYDTLDMTALIRFTPNEISQYELGYARKNRAPFIYELYPWSTSSMMMSMIGSFGDGNGYVGNLNLKSETAHNITLTAEFHDAENNTWEVKATPYFSYVENFIDVDRCSTCIQPTNGFYFLRYANHDARLWGFDMSGRADLYQDDIFGKFSTHTIMSYVRGERMDGGNLYHMMPFNLKLSLDHKLESWKSSIEMQFVDAKTDVQAIRNELPTSSYILLNAKTGYQWKNLRIDAGVDNILNKQYYHPLGGAYTGDYYAMSISFPDAGFRNNRNLPGMGRSVFVGMTLSF
ncbi:MAG: TonB-dependent receptor [Methylococcaceae bacterium]|nr:TonB-dependent receptor [Methylococcaceae bacterium]